MILTCALFHVAPLDVFRVSLCAQKKQLMFAKCAGADWTVTRGACAVRPKDTQEGQRLATALGVVSAANLILLSSSYIHVSDASNLTCTGNPLHSMRTCAATSLSPHL